MSVQAIVWVLECSESTLGDRLVLYSIANHCNPDGLDSYPCVSTIAKEARLSERQVQRCIQNLEVLGEIEIYRGGGFKGGHYFVMKKMLRPRCWYCGKDLFIERTIDHQMPRSRGGTDDLSNLVYACANCNARKHNKTVEEFRVYTETQRFFGEGEGRQFVTRPKPKGVTPARSRVTNKTAKQPQMSPEPSEEPSLEPSEKPIVPVALWLAFVEMRKKIRKPLTDHGGELIRRELAKLQAQGHDPIEVLEQSIRNDWQDVFPVRGSNGARPTDSREQQRHERSQQAIENVLGHRSGLADRLREGLSGGSERGTDSRLLRNAERPKAGIAAPSIPASDEAIKVPSNASRSTRVV